MPTHTSDAPNVSAYSLTIAKNGAFGFRATVDTVPTISGAGKTTEAATTAARTKLRKHLAELQAAGAPLPSPTPPKPAATEAKAETSPAAPAPRLLELLAQADASAPAAFLEERRKNAAVAAEFTNASRDIQKLFCDLLRLEGFGKALSYDSDRVENESGTTAQIRAWAEAPDLDLALAAEIYLPRDSGPLVVRNVRAGIKRKSLNRTAEVPIAIHESAGGAALYTNEVYEAFTKLVTQVSLAAEASREPDPPPEPTQTIWGAIDDLYDRVESLESGTALPSKTGGADVTTAEL
jgi:predicted RNase H-like HicB family nuclease